MRKPVLVVVLGVILYLIATSSGAGWLYVVSAAIGATVIVSALAPWWNVRGIETVRHAPILVTAGAPFECTLEVKSKGRLARHLLEIKDRFAGDTGRAVVTRLRRDAPVLLKYAVENPRRGIYTGGYVTVETGAPFGLFFKQNRARVKSEIVVYPRTFKVAELPPSATADAERGDKAESATLYRGHGGSSGG